MEISVFLTSEHKLMNFLFSCLQEEKTNKYQVAVLPCLRKY